ncbi:hypothetical protein [Lacrimispora sp.]|uniref:hypothetical protein n=1 Tax=Lacrimispora sp. TaxID=2719234 RepID=UPI003460058B
MAIKGAKSIAEYAIRKWLENEGFAMDYFTLEMTGIHEAVLTDIREDKLRLEYDPVTKTVVEEAM